MDQKTFDRFREVIYNVSGIKLADGKIALVRARVGKRMNQLHITEPKDYLEYVLSDAKGDEIVHLLDVISTNVTSFFREADHFDFLRARFSEWLKDGQRRFRFWSAGCSSWQEPYTIAMVLTDELKNNQVESIGVDLKILATDISTQVLSCAMCGDYHETKVEGIPSKYLSSCFNVNKKADGRIFTVKDSLKKLITFRRLNLSQTPFPMKGPIDMIFCRNTMIYFDSAVRKRLIGEFDRLAKTGGYLAVGHSESLTGFETHFHAMRPSLYQKRAEIARKAA
jgi:chemotaxis protein methyltransferase CheR